MAVSISAMIRVVIFLFLIAWIPTNAKVVDCESIVNEIKVFKSFSPAAISLYKNDLLNVVSNILMVYLLPIILKLKKMFC